ncbi:ABC transporter ATP-binding protein [Saliterribacillus persicus]|uniref:ATP-binding cassette subfamily B protein n=1 Tax=Saliterribacillus persicus TaxID=930114 RepID=A0A368X8E7_9BACI|nr:ABC transporter ATP-binding protein [Saliterribacillus persicus]RCW64240.1 ATP-binding cassette subfamily B protein [Saliterribacillus persicus]
MRKMWKYIHLYRKSMIIALSLMIVELIVELVQPLIMARIIDDGIVAEDLGVVYRYGALLLVLTVIAFIGGVSSSFFAADVSQGVGHDLRRDMYRNIQMFSAMKVQQFATSTLLTRMTNDVTQIQGLLFAFMRIMLRAPLFIILGIVMSFIIHPPLAWILLLTIPVLFFIMFWLMLKGMKYFKLVQEKIDQVNGIIRENLLAIRLVKAFHRMKFENKRFKKVNTSLKDKNKKALWVMEIVLPITMLIMNIAMIALLWFGNIQLNAGEAQAGEVVAIINYATRMLASFGVFSFLLMNVSRGRASAKRVNDVLDEEPDDVTTNSGGTAEIVGKVSFEKVDFVYPTTEQLVLKDLTFSVNASEKIGILGETGSGKSTLLHLIPYLYTASDGSIYIDDKPITDWGNQVRHGITLVPQEGFLFSGTIKENIAWGNEHLTDEEITLAAKDAMLHDFVMSLPDGYDTLVGQRGVNLSGGQKQRLSIARALADNPKILLLDDSTSALDAATEETVLEAIRKRACTTFLVSQKISSVIDADKILVLEKGAIVGLGKHEELLRNNQLYQLIWDSQTKEEVRIDEV